MKTFFFFLLILSVVMCSACSDTGVEKPDLNISPFPVETASKASEPTASTSTTSSSPPPTSESKEEPIIVDIEIPDGEIRIFIPKYPADFPTDETLNNWKSYMHDKCGVNINPIYSSRYSMIDVNMGKSLFIGVDIEELIEKSNLEGLVYINDMSALEKMIEKSMIIPVNDLINEIPALNGIPDVSYKQVSDSGENIWAVPFTNRVFGNPRVYNMEWLEILDFEVPETLEDFHALAEAVATLDPDGNGEDDSYICETKIGSILRDMEDVFRSFGVYLYAYDNVIMNPQSGNFEIAPLSENFIEAVTFVKNMIDEEYIYLKPTSDTSKDKQKCASVLYLYEGEETFNGLDYGFYLKGINESQLAYVRSAPFTIAVLKNTENPAAMLKAYVDMILNNPDSRGDLGIGIKDQDYFTAGEFIYYYRNGENELIGLPSYVPGAQYELKYTVSVADQTIPLDDEYFQSRKIDLSYMKKIEPYYQTDLVYTYDINDNDNRISTINNAIQPYILALFDSILIQEKAIDESINLFRNALKSMGILDILDDINFEKTDD